MSNICFIAHRGYSGRYLMNTEEAFIKAVEHGSGGIETDVRATKDGVLILSHDDDLLFEDGTRLNVAESTYEELTRKPLRNPLSDKKLYACTYERYLDTFFVMYKKDPEFVEKVKTSKGFCLHHFGDLCEAGETKLNDKQKAEFYPLIFDVMRSHMDRLQEDVSWLVEKFDYRNKDADWKNSQDAIQRGMQRWGLGVLNITDQKYPYLPVTT